MSWVTAYQKLGHRLFVEFIELKIDGSWTQSTVKDTHHQIHDILSADSSDDCVVHFIEPDGLRRILQFTQGGTIWIHQNILSYHPAQIVESHEVDEKAQAGKGKTRDIL